MYHIETAQPKWSNYIFQINSSQKQGTEKENLPQSQQLSGHRGVVSKNFLSMKNPMSNSGMVKDVDGDSWKVARIDDLKNISFL